MNPQAVAVSYGALELKRAYQHNLLFGLLLAATLHVSLLAGALVYRALTTAPAPPPAPPPPEPGVIDVENIPVATLTDVLRPTLVLPDLSGPIGIPVPFPDELVPSGATIPTRVEMAELQAAIGLDALGAIAEGSQPVVIDVGEYYPEPDEFVAVQVPPSCVHSEPPVYPDMARLTNREGLVIVKALVDREGKVIRTMVLQASGTKVGFEESAMAAIAKNRYKPAIQNGQPVAVWVTHRVEFKLK